MYKLLSLTCMVLLFINIKTQEYDEMTHDEIISESQLCGESNFNEGDCLQKPKCVFLHWSTKVLEGKLRLCMSYSEIMKYFIKNPTEYLKNAGTKNHRTINKSNFCDVLDDSTEFLGHPGEIHKCIVSSL